MNFGIISFIVAISFISTIYFIVTLGMEIYGQEILNIDSND